MAEIESEIRDCSDAKRRTQLKKKLSAYKSRLEKGKEIKNQQTMLSLRDQQIKTIIDIMRDELLSDQFKHIVSRIKREAPSLTKQV